MLHGVGMEAGFSALEKWNGHVPVNVYKKFHAEEKPFVNGKQ